MLGVAALCFYMRLLSHCHSTPAGPGQWLTPVFPLVSSIEFSFLLRCVCSNVHGAYVIGTLYIFPAWTASVTRPMCAALTAVTKQKCGGRELGNLGGSELQLTARRLMSLMSQDIHTANPVGVSPTSACRHQACAIPCARPHVRKRQNLLMITGTVQ